MQQREDGSKSRTTHESLQKALRILMSFTPTNRDKTVTDLCKESGYHKSTVSRLLQVLVSNGFLYQDPFSRKYSLGKSIFDLGSAIHQTIREKMVIIAQPYVDELRDSIGLDVGLEVLLDNMTILAYRAWGTNQFRSRFTLGDRLPAHIVAGGKAILAFSSTDLVDRMLKEGLTSLTPKTVTDPEMVKRRLTEYRTAGLACDLGESDVDYHFVAAPVFDFAERPVAAVVVGDLAEKVQEGFDPKVLSALRDTASKISARLMYSNKSGTGSAKEGPEGPKRNTPGR